MRKTLATKLRKATRNIKANPLDADVSLLDQTKINLAKLTDEERMSLFGDYCRSCGCDNPRCQCWNDE